MRYLFIILMVCLSLNAAQTGIMARRAVTAANVEGIAPCSDLITNNMLAWWKLDETSGNRTNAFTTGGFTWTENGTVSSTTGIKGNAAVMSGMNYLSATPPNSNPWHWNNNDWSAVFWVKGTDDGILIDAINGGASMFQLIASAETYTFKVYDNMGGSITVAQAAGMSSTWHMVAFGYDVSNTRIVISVDAAAYAESSTMSFSPETSYTEVQLNNGTLDEMATTARVWGADDLDCLYNNGIGRTYTGGHVQ